jgi:glycosyltransferase involved in cell wall biosynthesis
MKILEMGPYPPPHGGVQTNLVALRKYLLERGTGCAVINLTRYRKEDGDGIYYPKTALGVLKLLFQLDYDVIHVHAGGNFSLRHAALLLLCSVLPHKKIVFTFHSGGYPQSDAGRRARPRSLRGFALRQLDGLIAVNQELADLFRRFGVSPNRIRLIPPHSFERPSDDTQLPQPMEEFYATHHPSLVTVSGLEPEYDLTLQVEAVRRLSEIVPCIGLAIIGSGSLEAELRRKFTAAPHAKHVLLCGDIPHQATLRAIERSDLFLRSTLYDGDSISVREALCLGVPVIASDNGMRPAGVHLVPVSDLDALCRAIENLLKEPGHAQPSATDGIENLEAVVRFYVDLAGIPASRDPADG